MTPYSFANHGEETVHQGAVCAHDRQISRSTIRYWLGNSAFHYGWSPWRHTDDQSECPEGPAKEFGVQ